MEWNVNSRLGFIRNIKIAAIFVVSVFLLIANPSFAQDELANNKKDTIKKQVLRYPIKAKFEAKVYSVYRLVKTTKVKRIFADSAIQEYDRYCAYFFHILAPDNPQEGFTKIKVVVDSVEYKFEHDDFKDYFISRPEYMPSLTDDFIRNMTSMGIDFEMEYSPYGEVISLGGGLMEKAKEPFLIKNYQGNTYQKELWLRGLSDERLKLDFDLIKDMLPDKMVPLDTSWSIDVYTEADGVRFSGQGKATFESFIDGDFTLLSKFDSLRSDDDLLISTGIDKQFPELINSMASGNGQLVVGPNGIIKRAEMTVNAVVDARLKKMEFRDFISTKYSWEIFGRHMWR